MGKTMTVNFRTKRESNIELLRILSMVMIIAHHIAVHSGFSFSTEHVTLNRLWVQWLSLGGKIGVNVFVLISGYFLILSHEIKINKFLKLLLQILTYSVGIYFIFIILGLEPFGIKTFIKNLLPITFSKWWFASVYVLLYLLYPYINKLLTSLSKIQYQRLLILLLICWCIIPTVFTRSWQLNNLLWFIFLYSVAGYIRLHFNTKILKSRHYLLISFAIMLLTYLSAVIFDILGTKYPFFSQHATHFYGQQMLPIFLISITLFIGFTEIKLPNNSVINIVSSATFGVYLIHDDNYIRELLWETIFKNASYQNSNILIPYSVIQIIVVFIACTLIELVRIHLIEKAYSKPLDILSKSTNKWLEKFFSSKLFSKL